MYLELKSTKPCTLCDQLVQEYMNHMSVQHPDTYKINGTQHGEIFKYTIEFYIRGQDGQPINPPQPPPPTIDDDDYFDHNSVDLDFFNSPIKPKSPTKGKITNVTNVTNTTTSTKKRKKPPVTTDGNKPKKKKIKYPEHMKKHQCDICKKRFYLDVRLNFHKINVHFNCTTCGKVFPDRASVNHHINSIHKVEESFCKICGKQYSNKSALQGHMDAIHDQTTEKVKCPHCDNFYHPNILPTHVKTVHEDDKPMKPCHLCGKVMHASNIKRHIKQTHHENEEAKREYIKQRYVPCSFCGKEYSSKSALKMHEAAFHDDDTPKVNCDYCNKPFHPVLLNQHIRGNHENLEARKRECPICHVILHSGNLNRHMASFHSDQNVKAAQLRKRYVRCEKCDKEFSSSSSLKLHVAAYHDEERPREDCPYCKKPFHPILLGQHVRANHENLVARKKECDICGIVLYSGNLGRHMAAFHSGEEAKKEQIKKRQVNCPKCHKVCSTPTALRLHVAAIHEYHKPKKRCVHCKRLFHPDLMTSHMRNVHSGKVTVKEPCHLCGTMVNIRNMNRHMNTVHKGEEIYDTDSDHEITEEGNEDSRNEGEVETDSGDEN